MHIYIYSLHASLSLYINTNLLYFKPTMAFTYKNTTLGKKKLFFMLLLATLVVSPGFSIRPGVMMTTMTQEQHERKPDSTGSQAADQLGLLLSMLPKGEAVPPSAPSKRHNSVIGSTPHL
ncbi:hypothetical protein SSX86_028902 [Deinandra increscens subsp. villosa]|uniref:Uncharacterized protein n=1 Tax=Deinandra increscens subsp. villosa TaxID=3103831 RepID=A0AAP0GJP4_9ASTR